MLRKEQRRRERRAVLRTRVIAAGTAVLLALGAAIGGATAATANGGSTNTNGEAYWQQLPGEICVKPSFSTEDSAATPYTLPTISADRTYSKVIVKAGSSGRSVVNENAVFTTDRSGGTLTAGDTFVHPEKGSISHVIYCTVPTVPAASTGVDCTTIEFLVGRALNGSDHINVDIVYNGTRGQINVEINEVQPANGDPASSSGLYALYKFDAIGLANVKVPISAADAAAGRIVFAYSTYLTGQWTIEWIQFNSTYFNKERVTANFVVCGDLPTDELVTPTARMVDLECDTAGSYTLDRVEGIRWFIGDAEVQPGTYRVTEASTVTVRAVAIAPDYGIEPGAQTEWTFVFTEPDDCVLPCLPASAVSYTYYNLSTATVANPANSGVITVAAREGYSTELCNDFWVVAAAWNYTSSTSIWPQTLRSTDPAGDHSQGYIGSVGTYAFHAPVACGQGDVYASFTGMPYVGPELFGPSNPFSETFLHSMGFTGPNPTYLNTAPGCNVVNPIAPTANPIVECDTTGSIDIGDVANPYIGYTVYRGAADENGSVAGLATVNLVDATEGVFTVVANPLGGYIFPNGTVRQWEFNLGEAYECAEPEFDGRTTTASQCDNDTPWINYSVVVNDPDGQLSNTTASITFVHPTDATKNHTVVLGEVTPGEALQGRVLWPGASVDPITNEPTGWPGWAFVDGEWVETADDVNFRWTRALTEVTLSVNPSMQIAIAYPPASDDCAAGPVEIEPIATKSTCLDGGAASYTLPAIDAVTWFVDGQQTAAGTIPVLVAGAVDITFAIDADAEGGPFALKPGAAQSFAFSFTDDEICDLPELPITDASIGFIAPTCEVGQLLDPTKFVVTDAELARYAPELSSLTGPTYSVVFVTIDDDARFFDSSTPVAGRTVSAGGTVLTFTGTLLGPDPEACTTLPLIDPFDFVDTCTEQSFTLYYVQGITYWVTINDDEPFAAVFGLGEASRTFLVEQGDRVSVEPTADPGYRLAPDQPTPLDRAFAVYGEDDCQLPELPNWPASVTAADQVCSPLGMTGGTITVQFSTGPEGNPTPVRYYLAYGTPQQQELTSAVTAVAPGSHVVTAVATVSTDSINDAGNTAVFPVTVDAAADQECELPTLALTGATSALAGLGAFSLLLLLIGFGIMTARRQQA
ncbi:hypothetical protein [Microcella sp.]|uniref:hypothetical protein n=1 Tax=Microcella sp. TaxID=1913979 RepID=UPI00391D7284